jgi:hypothetical protein
LQSLEEYKTFLYSIFEKENPQWCKDQLSKKKKLLDRIKKEWIEMNKLHKDGMGDDDIFIQELLMAQGEQESAAAEIDDHKKG